MTEKFILKFKSFLVKSIVTIKGFISNVCKKENFVDKIIADIKFVKSRIKIS